MDKHFQAQRAVFGQTLDLVQRELPGQDRPVEAKPGQGFEAGPVMNGHEG